MTYRKATPAENAAELKALAVRKAIQERHYARTGQYLSSSELFRIAAIRSNPALAARPSVALARATKPAPVASSELTKAVAKAVRAELSGKSSSAPAAAHSVDPSIEKAFAPYLNQRPAIVHTLCKSTYNVVAPGSQSRPVPVAVPAPARAAATSPGVTSSADTAMLDKAFGLAKSPKIEHRGTTSIYRTA